ncbi:MAG TPA: TIGR03084 family metal-binding protein [Streptosporangiaceae bacterium]|nr:TIGR03084 family metal-binding protein [Streptosporangiaceae bacterium]
MRDRSPGLLAGLLDDLVAETKVLTGMLAPLDDPVWERPTPAPGWAIRDQVSHLAYFDDAATLAATDPDRFRAETAALTAGLDTAGAALSDQIAVQHRQLSAAELREWLGRARAEYVRVLGGLDARTRLPWYGPDMSAASSVTARLMETWAHGQDVADALGVRRPATARLRHVAHLGVATLGFSFIRNGRGVPAAPVRVELAGPDGETWSWGPSGAPDSVTGPALDFCLAVTQRRHLDDLRLRVTGPVAAEWMSIAQAFAGPPGPGRRPGQFPEDP